MHVISRWTQTDFGRIHARVPLVQPRNEQSVILVPGLVVASEYMLPTLERLAPLCRVAAVDLPGYGLSEKPRSVLTLSELADALADWMRQEGLSRAHLVANSFGCQILGELALRHPDRVDRLVLQGPTIDPAARTFWEQFSRVVQNSRREGPGLGPIMRRDYWRARGCDESWEPSGWRCTIDSRRNCHGWRLRRCSSGGNTIPWCLNHGRSKSAGCCLTESWSSSRAAGHTINFTVPEAFVTVLASFLRL